jgi:hypothetical protein
VGGESTAHKAASRGLISVILMLRAPSFLPYPCLESKINYSFNTLLISNHELSMPTALHYAYCHSWSEVLLAAGRLVMARRRRPDHNLGLPQNMHTGAAHTVIYPSM